MSVSLEIQKVSSLPIVGADICFLVPQETVVDPHVGEPFVLSITALWPSTVNRHRHQHYQQGQSLGVGKISKIISVNYNLWLMPLMEDGVKNEWKIPLFHFSHLPFPFYLQYFFLFFILFPLPLGLLKNGFKSVVHLSLVSCHTCKDFWRLCKLKMPSRSSRRRKPIGKHYTGEIVNVM